MLRCHCSARTWGLCTWWRRNLLAELPIASMGFPEHALPRMCPDCSSGRARQPLSRPGPLSHQIITCQHSSLCNLGAWSEHKGAAYSETSLYPQKQAVWQQVGRLQPLVLLQHQPGTHSHSTAHRNHRPYLYPLQRELYTAWSPAHLRDHHSRSQDLYHQLMQTHKRPFFFFYEAQYTSIFSPLKLLKLYCECVYRKIDPFGKGLYTFTSHRKWSAFKKWFLLHCDTVNWRTKALRERGADIISSLSWSHARQVMLPYLFSPIWKLNTGSNIQPDRFHVTPF